MATTHSWSFMNSEREFANARLKMNCLQSCMMFLSTQLLIWLARVHNPRPSHMLHFLLSKNLKINFPPKIVLPSRLAAPVFIVLTTFSPVLPHPPLSSHRRSVLSAALPHVPRSSVTPIRCQPLVTHSPMTCRRIVRPADLVFSGHL